MKNYKNITSNTLMFSLTTETKPMDYIIHPSEECELPASNKYVERLAKQNIIAEVAEATKITPKTETPNSTK